MSLKRKIKKVVIYLGVNVFIAVVIVFFLTPRSFATWQGIAEVRDDILYSLVLCLVLGAGNEYLNDWLDQRVSWIYYPTKRFLLNTVALLTYSFVASLAVAFVFIQLFLLIILRKYPGTYT